jgi:membrane associated rhomboid family serine protease
MTEETTIKTIIKHPFYFISVLSALSFLVLKVLQILNVHLAGEFLFLSLNLKQSVLKPWTYLLSLFLHRDFFHLLGNMLILYIFYSIYETFLLQSSFLKHFLAGGIVSFLMTQIFMILFFEKINGYLIGSSASVFFIGMHATCRFPNYSVRLMLLPPLKLKWFIGILALLMLLTSAPSNIAGLLSHGIGLLSGYVYYLINHLTFKKNQPVKPNQKLQKTSSSPDASQDSEAMLNKLLDKINDKGFESLTEKEKSLLEKLSKKYKK